MKNIDVPHHLTRRMAEDDAKSFAMDKSGLSMPLYSPESYYQDLAVSDYFKVLITIRHYIELASHHFFGIERGAKVMDLYMITSAVSSPMGPGSDSEPIPIEFGGISSFLVDSSQFGFEPLIQSGLDEVYCYLPSMRGEDPDPRHLNQFFHCEAEIAGQLGDVLSLAESYLRFLSKILSQIPNSLRAISGDPLATIETLSSLEEYFAKSGQLPRIKYADAIEILEKTKIDGAIKVNEYGKIITEQGELLLLDELGFDTIPVWLTHHPRDLVPFYQKSVGDEVLNADLLFPSLSNGSFGGEVIGAGQRQEDPQEMIESLRRQGVPEDDYEWYIELRRAINYRPSSGFGMGIERFIAWILCKNNIMDVSLYPRIKGVKSYP